MRSIAVLAAAVTVLAVPAVAEARKFRTIKSSGTILGHLAQPATSEGYAFAGFLSDSKLGQGATTSQGSFSGLTTTGGLIAFFDNGTLRASFDFVSTPHADGTITFLGTTRYRGGTGAFKGARGSGDVTATQDADGYTRFEYTQKVRIPRR
ncbi:MAG TPA: hypothetical protein VD836_00845 [Solirubrobacteraceae bacterium]|nr:hypothetical protein [Solirubrobacteraceae bacterium]